MMNGARVRDFLYLNMNVVNNNPEIAEVEATGSLLFTNNMKLGEFLDSLTKYKEVRFNFEKLELFIIVKTKCPKFQNEMSQKKRSDQVD